MLFDNLALEIVELAESANAENHQSIKLQLDARRWAAERRAPYKWGNRQQVEHTGQAINKISINWVEKEK